MMEQDPKRARFYAPFYLLDDGENSEEWPR